MILRPIAMLAAFSLYISTRPPLFSTGASRIKLQYLFHVHRVGWPRGRSRPTERQTRRVASGKVGGCVASEQRSSTRVQVDLKAYVIVMCSLSFRHPEAQDRQDGVTNVL